ncbi:MAG: hypothetical protein KatS3mg017_0417 [Fimbriimonadales bacterium]|nr:MAG: hypothetical protein KatS3mg017_0417 [Fimbriimonadales bacterium]
MDAHTGQRNPVAWTVLSKRLPAGTELSLLRWLAGARQPLRRSSPWLAQSCPSVFLCRDKTVPATSPPWLAQSCPSVFLCRDKTVPATRPPWLGQSCPSVPPCRDKTVPATRPPWLGQSCPSVPPCRDKTVPATSPPWLRQSCPSVPPCRDKTVPATKPPVACTVLSKRFPLQGQDCPCYEAPRGLHSLVQAFHPAGTRLSLLRDFSNSLKARRLARFFYSQSADSCPSA